MYKVVRVNPYIVSLACEVRSIKKDKKDQVATSENILHLVKMVNQKHYVILVGQWKLEPPFKNLNGTGSLLYLHLIYQAERL